jgi:Sec-independent protein translocase protein TatA
MFGNLDPVRILMLLLAAVVLLGPERLPRAARQLGSLWRDLVKMRERLETEVRSALPDLDLPKIPTVPSLKKGAVAGYINSMMTPSEATAAGGLVAEGSEAAVSVDGPSAFGSARPGSSPEFDYSSRLGGARPNFPTTQWQSSHAGEGELPDVPAGWNSQADWLGYASGARLATVPSSTVRGGHLRVETVISLEDPGWN